MLAPRSPTSPAAAITSGRKSWPRSSRSSAGSSSTGASTRSSERRSAGPSTPCHSKPERRELVSEITENPIREAIAEAIGEHEVILFMKGTPEQPTCGFSARTAAALEALGKPYAAVDVLPDPRIRQELSAISNWPTIPQLFVRGELVGGCDIVTEMYETGELAQVLGVQPPADAPDEAPVAAEAGAAPLSIENRLDS